MNGISAFIGRDTTELPLSVPGHGRIQWSYTPGNGPIPDTGSTSSLILGFSISTTMKNKMSCDLSPLVHGTFVIAALNYHKHIPKFLNLVPNLKQVVLLYM